MGLFKVIWCNNADPRKWYLGPKILTKDKRYYYERTEGVVYKKTNLKMGCIPQIWTRRWLNARCHVGSNHPRIYNPKMYCPCRLLSNKAFHHFPNNFHSFNLFWYLIRGLSNLEFLLSSWPFPRFEVVGFPIGLSPRTMQYFGSVQNPVFLLSSWFPHRFESEDHAIPWFCPKLDRYW